MTGLWLPTAFAFILGTAIGSFLNVVIYRVPAGEPLTGRSHCPACSSPVQPRDNIPVVGWLLLRGKCRTCQARISAQYPIVEAVTGVAFAAIVWFTPQPSLIPTLLYFAAISIALTMIDLRTLRLPNAIVLPSIIVVAVTLALAAGLTQEWPAFLRAAAAAGVLTGVYGLLWLGSGGRAFGFGDVKLAVILGAITGYLGWPVFLIGIAAGWFTGALVAVVGLVAGKVQRGKPVPFGPALIAGAWIAIAFGQPIAQWYASLLHR